MCCLALFAMMQTYSVVRIKYVFKLHLDLYRFDAMITLVDHLCCCSNAALVTPS